MASVANIKRVLALVTHRAMTAVNFEYGDIPETKDFVLHIRFIAYNRNNHEMIIEGHPSVHAEGAPTRLVVA